MGSLLMSGSLAVLLLLGGCGRRQATELGLSPSSAPLTQISTLAANSTEPVTLQGHMTEKCPVAGCWFRLKDQSGIIKVDTKEAGFVVTDVPVNVPLTVSGATRREKGGELYLVATGIRY
jgi:uncharacterized protein YdeI (BOF family)